MLIHELAEAKVDCLRTAVELHANLMEAHVLVTTHVDHRTLLGLSPAVIVLGELDDAGDGDGTLDGILLRAGVHLVMRGILPCHSTIRFLFMKLSLFTGANGESCDDGAESCDDGDGSCVDVHLPAANPAAAKWHESKGLPE